MAAVGLLLLLALLAPVPAAAQGTLPPDDPNARARRILADPAFQQKQPQRRLDGSGGAEEDRGRCLSFPARQQRRERERQPEPVGAEERRPLDPQPVGRSPQSGVLSLLSGVVLQLVFWILLAAVVAVVMVWLFREVGSMRRRPRRKRTGPGYETASGEVPALPIAHLSRADELAEQGAFGEATHQLLLLALRRLDTNRVVNLAAGTTSREVIGTLAGSSRLRPHLAVLVQAVERFLFGGTALDASDYTRCREAFHQLTAGHQLAAGERP